MSLLLQWRLIFRIDLYPMLMRVIFILLLLVSGGASASLTSQQGLPAQYMQTTEDAAIWAQVGNAVVNVGNVRAGQILAVFRPRRITMNFVSDSVRGLLIKSTEKCRVSNASRIARDLEQAAQQSKPHHRKDTPVYNAPAAEARPLAP